MGGILTKEQFHRKLEAGETVQAGTKITIEYNHERHGDWRYWTLHHDVRRVGSFGITRRGKTRRCWVVHGTRIEGGRHALSQFYAAVPADAKEHAGLIELGAELISPQAPGRPKIIGAGPMMLAPGCVGMLTFSEPYGMNVWTVLKRIGSAALRTFGFPATQEPLVKRGIVHEIQQSFVAGDYKSEDPLETKLGAAHGRTAGRFRAETKDGKRTRTRP